MMGGEEAMGGGEGGLTYDGMGGRRGSQRGWGRLPREGETGV